MLLKEKRLRTAPSPCLNVNGDCTHHILPNPSNLFPSREFRSKSKPQIVLPTKIF